MEAKHWFGAVALGAVLVGVSFAFNEYKAPGDTPGAQPFVADLKDDTPAVKTAPLSSPVSVSAPVLPVAGTSTGGGSKTSGGGSGGGKAAVVKGEPVKTSLANAVVGRVKWDGKAPRVRTLDVSSDAYCPTRNPDGLKGEAIVVDGDGNVQNVVVYIKNVPEGHGGKKGSEQPDMIVDQVGCRYVPHVVAVQLGQSVKIRNSDAALHNVHFVSKLNGDWNLTQSPNRTDGPKQPFAKSEIGTSLFKCDIHPWMKAMAAFFDHPYFAVSKADGTFEIDTTGLPDGDYEIWAWQEKYKYAKVKGVSVKQGKVVQLQFSFNKKKKNKGAVVEAN